MRKSAVATTGEIRPVEAARALGVELGYIYLLLRSGKLEGRKTGRLRRAFERVSQDERYRREFASYWAP